MTDVTSHHFNALVKRTWRWLLVSYSTQTEDCWNRKSCAHLTRPSIRDLLPIQTFPSLCTLLLLLLLLAVMITSLEVTASLQTWTGLIISCFCFSTYMAVFLMRTGSIPRTRCAGYQSGLIVLVWVAEFWYCGHIFTPQVGGKIYNSDFLVTFTSMLD